jgi:hypothetical protein
MPTMLDQLRYLPTHKTMQILRPEHIKRIQAAIPRARQFVFDEEASGIVGDFIRACPDILVRNEEFAIIPFPVTYIEYPLDPIIKAIGRVATSVDDTRDTHVGYLIIDGDIYVVARSVNSGPEIGPIVYSNGWSTASKISVMLSKLNYHRLFMGTSVLDLPEEEQARFVMGYRIWYAGPPEEAKSKALTSVLQGSAGEIRNYIALLLMLYQKQGISLTMHPPQRAIFKGKNVAYMAATKVKIHLSNEHAIRKAFRVTDRQGPRAHEVRPHYAHFGGTRHCEHVWEQRDPSVTRWWCERCGQERRLRRAHTRGDASKGFVDHSYDVTK